MVVRLVFLDKQMPSSSTEMTHSIYSSKLSETVSNF